MDETYPENEPTTRETRVRPLWKHADVAAAISVTVERVHDLVKRDAIPYVRVSPRLIRFVPEEIEAWLAEHPTP